MKGVMIMELKYQYYIGATAETVWKILVEDEGVKQIFYGSVLKSTFEPGAHYEYVGPGDAGEETVHVYGKVLVFEPYKTMSFTEHPGPSYNVDHANLESRITMTLEPVGNTTKLTLVNDNWSEDHPSIERTADIWPTILSNIKTLAETGKTLDFGW
jgi:uncharacterized protein YndB with AHSA1/START domain